MPINFRHKTIIDSLSGGISPWATGSGTIGVWTQAGLTSENERVNGTDPFGDTSVVWESRPNGGGGNTDGGWIQSSYVALDNTKLYRFSVWIKRTSATSSGRYYFGTDGGPGGVEVKNVNNDADNTNPYWDSALISTLTQNTWYLYVGHLFPVDYTPGTYGYNVIVHPNSGVWTRAGGKISGPVGGSMNGGDVKFGTGSPGVIQRTFHYDSTSTAAHLQFYDPRIELCDGSEGTVESLLEGPTTYSGNTLGSTSITKEGAAFKNQEVIATGGDWTEEFGEWRAHIFTGSGTFNLQSYVGSAVETDYLIVAGGGGGGTNMGGGAGGGGVLTGYCYVSGTTYTIAVGSAGSGAPAGTGSHPSVQGTNGGNSTFNGLTAYGGGWGGLSPNTYSTTQRKGADGGCGGASTGYNNDDVAPATYGSGAGTSGQGFRGGYQGQRYYAGGGGGAGSAGIDGNSTPHGGVGKFSAILGRPHYWGGGGGGAGYTIGGGDGGIGGGGGGANGIPAGSGGVDSINWGDDGTPGATSSQCNVPGGNGGIWTGGGGGSGSHYNYTNAGGNGGSGIVVIRYKYR